MWRELLVLISLLGITACSSSGKISRPAGKPPFYITHHNYVDEELDLLWGRDGLPDFPPAILIQTGYTQTLAPAVLGHKKLSGLLDELAKRDVRPKIFLVLYVDGIVLDEICSGDYTSELTEMATVLAGYSGDIFLAVGLQPNSAMLPISPEQFLPGYGCLQNLLLDQGLDDVQYGLYFFGQGPNYKNLPITDWYPENARVDWLGVTGSRLTEELMQKSVRFTQRNHPNVLNLAEDQNLPVYIVNSDPNAFGYDSGVRGDSLYRSWYVPTLNYLKEEPRILGFGHQSKFISQDSVIAAGVRRMLVDWHKQSP